MCDMAKVALTVSNLSKIHFDQFPDEFSVVFVAPMPKILHFKKAILYIIIIEILPISHFRGNI